MVIMTSENFSFHFPIGDDIYLENSDKKQITSTANKRKIFPSFTGKYMFV